MCFPVNLVKFLRIPFLTEHVWWLLLALSLKKREGKPYQYQSLQRFFSEYTYVKYVPDSLQLSQKQTKLNTHTYQKRL